MAGKRIPESPYTRQSGQEVGFEIPNHSVFSETAGMLSDNELILNKSSIHNCLKEVVNLESDESVDDWDTDSLLNENSPPRPRGREAALRRSKKKLNSETFRKDKQAKVDTRRTTHEPQTITVDGFQCELSDDSSRGATKQRRSNNNRRVGSDFAEPSHRNRRLVKKTAKRCDTETSTYDAEQQSRTREDVNECVDLSKASVSSRDDTISASDCERRDETYDINDLDSLVDTSLHNDNALNAEGRNMKGNSSDVQNLNEDIGESNQPTLDASVEVSCVICWTEFCSARGVLQCGHRFCFSCIQSWADRMASERRACTCPLCKASFDIITKVEATGSSSDQKIYSQTIPCAFSSENVFRIPGERVYLPNVEIARVSVCCFCQSQDPEHLMYCNSCGSSCIHDYCLDPYQAPWTCSHCRQHPYFYRR